MGELKKNQNKTKQNKKNLKDVCKKATQLGKNDKTFRKYHIIF